MSGICTSVCVRVIKLQATLILTTINPMLVCLVKGKSADNPPPAHEEKVLASEREREKKKMRKIQLML